MTRSVRLDLGAWNRFGDADVTIAEGDGAYLRWSDGGNPLLLIKVDQGRLRVMLYGPLGDDIAAYELDPDRLGGVWQPDWT